MQNHLEAINLSRKYNVIREFDTQEVEVKCFDSGLQHTYQGTLYFGTGKHESIMIGLDEIMIDSIIYIKTKDKIVKFELVAGLVQVNR